MQPQATARLVFWGFVGAVSAAIMLVALLNVMGVTGVELIESSDSPRAIAGYVLSPVMFAAAVIGFWNAWEDRRYE